MAERSSELFSSLDCSRYEGSNPVVSMSAYDSKVVSMSAYDRKVEISLSEPAVGSNLVSP